MKTYIIHVKGNKLREAFIKNQINKTNLESEFILDGNIEDLKDDFLNKYFSERMTIKNAITSCTTKHFLAYERIVNCKDEVWFLILEDDMMFYKDANINLEKIVNELLHRKINKSIVSLEDSNLKYVKRSESKRGVYIYKKKFGRLAGAYLIDREGAKAILDYAKQNKNKLPIDWFHNECETNGIISIYWSKLLIACQGSNSGKVPSLLDSNKNYFFRKIKFKIERIYKKFLYFLR